jgi:hypothetical protein
VLDQQRTALLAQRASSLVVDRDGSFHVQCLYGRNVTVRSRSVDFEASMACQTM